VTRDQVRREWRWYAAAAWAQVAGSVGLSTYVFLRYDQHTADHAAFPVVANALFVAYTYFIVDYNRVKPHIWLASTARFAAASWVVLLLYYFSMAGSRPPPIALPAFWLGVLCVVALIVAGLAKSRAMAEVGPDEILTADLATRFDVRDNNAVFHVDGVKVMLVCTVPLWRTADGRIVPFRRSGSPHRRRRTSVACSLGDIKKMRTIQLRQTRTVALPGNNRKILKLSEGPALRFDSPVGEWIVTTNRAEDALEAIKDKRAKLRGSGPGLPANTFLPENL
jgi:hypothetical protein